MVGGTRSSSTITSSDTLVHPRSLRTLLQETTTFVRIVELVTTRGSLSEGNVAHVVTLGTELARLGTAHALSITDNPGGHPRIAPESLGQLLREHEQEVIIHLTCKDLNRNGLESRAWTLASAGFENVLCLSGDYPVAGYQGRAAPVFDIDSVALLEMLHEMNRGLRLPGRNGGEPSRLPPTHLFLGAVVSPFKQQERELLPQYLKLARKVASGAEFLITQVGYDSRKLDELLKYMALKQLAVPVIANIFVLTAATARYFHRGAVPGVFVSDDLLALAEKQANSPDKGKRFFHELAAKQVAVARGLGYRGAYLGGNLSSEEVHAIFEKADSFGPGDWQTFARELQFPHPGTFYFFEPDPATGLNSTEVNRAYLASLTPESRRRLQGRVPLLYRFSRLLHDLLFHEGSAGFAMGRRLYSRIDGSAGLKRWAHGAEQAAKTPLFGCRDCGDCSLPDVAYLCPESQCAKNQRNGPCGGSRGGLCEIRDKECIWARAYQRLKPYGEEEQLLDRPVVFKDGRLRGTSSWANTFLGRDHHADAGKDTETQGRG